MCRVLGTRRKAPPCACTGAPAGSLTMASGSPWQWRLVGKVGGVRRGRRPAATVGEMRMGAW
uniref:Uncharacterized protein n=1 Tax=Arundo donax TaxID=35708 RepID=A0A0A9H5Z0_ARUDO